jgi:hypothetical protein
MSEGYMLCAFGADNYMKMANRLIKNIRVYDKHRPIIILTNDIPRLVPFIEDPSGVSVGQFQLEEHMYPSMDPQNEWNKFGLYPKLYSPLYSPFNTTMFIDVDMVFHKDFTFLWSGYSKDPSILSICGLSDVNNRAPPSWHWGYINTIMHYSGLNLPQTSSTLMMYKEPFQQILLEKLPMIFEREKAWQLQRKYRDSLPDEIFFSILMAQCGIKPNEFMYHWVFNEENVATVDKL